MAMMSYADSRSSAEKASTISVKGGGTSSHEHCMLLAYGRGPEPSLMTPLIAGLITTEPVHSTSATLGVGAEVRVT